ncbi:hypothetical protein JKP75_10135 [Blastococcus sp. TML/M2B]|nr:hypothetical protein [Blastococcus sp. TML/M2B]MBN1097005.1 hypothetical protein [Blastococcus sp. TML/C7B]
MHDIADLERRGVVGVFLASEVFDEAARLQSATLGFPAPYVLVPHPVQDRTDEEMRAAADGAYAAVVAAVTAAGEAPA